jgi:hypothetical protein
MITDGPHPPARHATRTKAANAKASHPSIDYAIALDDTDRAADRCRGGEPRQRALSSVT